MGTGNGERGNGERGTGERGTGNGGTGNGQSLKRGIFKCPEIQWT